MLGAWSLVRFVHVMGAVIWVGGQLTISVFMLPAVRRRLEASQQAVLMRDIGVAFGKWTIAFFIPLQILSGALLAWHNGVTFGSLLEPGYGRTLFAKLLTFALVMLAAGGHGWANATGRRTLARSLAIASLMGSIGIVLLATALATD